MAREQDVSEIAHPDWGCGSITYTRLNLFKVIAQEGWCKRWGYRHILRWRSPDIRNNESESHCRRIAVVSQGRFNENVYIDPWAIGIPHHFQLRAGSLGLCLQSISILLKNFRNFGSVLLQRFLERLSVVGERLLVIRNQLVLISFDTFRGGDDLVCLCSATYHFPPLQNDSCSTYKSPYSDHNRSRSHYFVGSAYLLAGVATFVEQLWWGWEWMDGRLNGWWCAIGSFVLWMACVSFLVHALPLLID
jgi:hypothetical protein